MSDLPVRQPVVAGQFYPGDRKSCVRMIEQYLPTEPSPDLPDKIFAGLVPHAGWVFSGAVAARVFAAIHAQGAPTTFFLLSAMHRWGTSRSAVYAAGRWATPLGEVEVDEEMASAVLEAGADLLTDAPEAHAGEHSAEVQVPFIQYLFPEAKILPIMIPPNEQAAHIGEIIGHAISAAQRAVAVVGTTDLTHYGSRYYGFAPAGTGERAGQRRARHRPHSGHASGGHRRRDHLPPQRLRRRGNRRDGRRRADTGGGERLPAGLYNQPPRDASGSGH
jgi:AmmeMemoRadiSam system protein B